MTLAASDVQSMLKAEREDALGVTSSSLSDDRKRALEYYVGEMHDMPSQDGRSAAISTDVSDTVQGLMPVLMKIFAASEQVVRFEAVGEEDEEAAEQETDYVNHVFMQKNPGFMILYTFIQDALLSKLGVVKVYWDKTEKQIQETYIGQPPEVVAQLAQQADVEIIKDEKRDEYGEEIHDITLRTRKEYACAKAEPVPPEEFGVSKAARTLAEANYCYHEPTGRTESDLIAQGYDKAQVKALPGSEEGQSGEAANRDQGQAVKAINTSMRAVKVTEHYIRMDYEEDGSPQLYRVTTGSDRYEILKREGKEDVVAVDAMPFAVMTPIPLTHRIYGRSIADLVMDIQKIKTAVLRALLDNFYLANNQRVEVAESHKHERTLDDLLVNRPGGIVRTKTPGGINIIPNQPLGPQAFPLIEYLDGTREWRTGVTRQGQGIDANSLQNQSATAVNQMFTAAQARVELIARILAETGIRDMMGLLHATIRKNDRKQNTVRLRNKWVQVNPRAWKTREDMTINVGLGTGSKGEQVSHLMTVLGIQKEAMLAGLPIVTPKNVYNTLDKLVERIDLKTIEPYFTDPDSPEAQQIAQAQAQKPDPEMMKLQVQAQFDERALAQKGQLDQQGMNLKAQIETLQAQADIATNDRKIQADIGLAERKFELERELAILSANIKVQEHQQNVAEKQQSHSQGIEMADRKTGRLKQADHSELLGAQNALLEALERLAAQQDATHKAVTSPRHNKIVRDAKGKVSGAISTMVQ